MPARGRAWLWWVVAAKFALGWIPACLPLAILPPAAAIHLWVPPALVQTIACVVCTLLCVAWAVGLVKVVRFTIQAWRQAHTQLLSSDGTERHFLIAECYRLCFFMGIKNHPRIREAKNLRTPLLTGVFPATMILPSEVADGWSALEMRMMVAHELSHLRRKDLVYGWAPVMAQILCWFNPLVWLAVSEWEIAKESACDELAIEATASTPAQYGRMLLNMALPSRPAAAGVGAVGFWVPAKSLKRRLLALHNIDSWTRPRARIATYSYILLLAPLLAPWHLVPAATPLPVETARIAMVKPPAAAIDGQSGHGWLHGPRKLRPQSGPGALPATAYSPEAFAAGVDTTPAGRPVRPELSPSAAAEGLSTDTVPAAPPAPARRTPAPAAPSLGDRVVTCASQGMDYLRAAAENGERAISHWETGH